MSASHDWSAAVDRDHLAHIRRHAAEFAPGGVLHLVLEVLAYAADEAEHTGRPRCAVTFHPDGSIEIADSGRGTDTRLDASNRPVRKPVMATKDLRFFDAPDAPLLPDGRPRRGMSVVAAFSEWLTHTNRRLAGAWTQRYEHGVPVTDLVPIDADGTTGTEVRFRPDDAMQASQPSVAELSRLAMAWPQLSIAITDHRLGTHGRSPCRPAGP